MKVLGPISPVQLVGHDLHDELSLSLAHAPLLGVRQQLEDGSVRYTVALGQALGRRALMDLLYTLAPYKAHGPDRFARVLDNWGLHDRAATNGGSQALFLQHAKSLKSSWQVFSEHRRLFMSIFEDQSENTRSLPVLTWEKRAGGERKWRFDLPDATSMRALVGVAHSASHPDALLGLVTIPYFLPELRKKWNAWQPLVKNGKSNYIGPASVPMICLMHRRALLNSTLVRSAQTWLDTALTE
jgi:hypothetical protein